MATSCYDDNRESPVEYTLTVTTDGNGTAQAAIPKGIAGEIVTLTATPNNGYTFKGWTGEEEVLSCVDSVFMPLTSLTMPAADVSIRAEFETVSKTETPEED